MSEAVHMPYENLEANLAALDAKLELHTEQDATNFLRIETGQNTILTEIRGLRDSVIRLDTLSEVAELAGTAAGKKAGASSARWWGAGLAAFAVGIWQVLSYLLPYIIK